MVNLWNVVCKPFRAVKLWWRNTIHWWRIKEDYYRRYDTWYSRWLRQKTFILHICEVLINPKRFWSYMHHVFFEIPHVSVHPCPCENGKCVAITELYGAFEFRAATEAETASCNAMFKIKPKEEPNGAVQQSEEVNVVADNAKSDHDTSSTS